MGVQDATFAGELNHIGHVELPFDQAFAEMLDRDEFARGVEQRPRNARTARGAASGGDGS